MTHYPSWGFETEIHAVLNGLAADSLPLMGI